MPIRGRSVVPEPELPAVERQVSEREVEAERSKTGSVNVSGIDDDVKVGPPGALVETVVKARKSLVDEDSQVQALDALFQPYMGDEDELLTALAVKLETKLYVFKEGSAEPVLVPTVEGRRTITHDPERMRVKGPYAHFSEVVFIARYDDGNYREILFKDHVLREAVFQQEKYADAIFYLKVNALPILVMGISLIFYFTSNDRTARNFGILFFVNAVVIIVSTASRYVYTSFRAYGRVIRRMAFNVSRFFHGLVNDNIRPLNPAFMLLSPDRISHSYRKALGYDLIIAIPLFLILIIEAINEAVYGSECSCEIWSRIMLGLQFLFGFISLVAASHAIGVKIQILDGAKNRLQRAAHEVTRDFGGNDAAFEMVRNHLILKQEFIRESADNVDNLLRAHRLIRERVSGESVSSRAFQYDETPQRGRQALILSFVILEIIIIHSVFAFQACEKSKVQVLKKVATLLITLFAGAFGKFYSNLNGRLTEINKVTNILIYQISRPQNLTVVGPASQVHRPVN